MAQADSVLSTPPTNTSPTRRKILGTFAAAAAATTIAAKPVPALVSVNPDAETIAAGDKVEALLLPHFEAHQRRSGAKRQSEPSRPALSPCWIER